MPLPVSDDEPIPPPEQPPDYLYKFLSLGKRDRVKSIVVDSQIYFSAGAEINDPFEFRTNEDVLFDATDEQGVAWLFSVVRRQKPNLDDEGVEAEATAQWRAHKRQDPRQRQAVEERFKHLLETRMRARTGVFSLSATRSHPLLWAHYADGHRGLALQFATDRGSVPKWPNLNFFGAERAREVKYSADMPKVRHFVDDDVTAARRMLTNKACFWSYEKEWRVMAIPEGPAPERGPGPAPYPPEALTGVVLGESIAETDVVEVLKWFRSRPYAASVYRAVPSRTRYELSIELDHVIPEAEQR